ncbi:MAG: decaprenyl-phosphate phosphoribosyltransferase [Candidatus Omnitrophica bacterium]|nr:decaprenyl-phosphate phosphoribosyltransferase [Candidatus Omnitrophota bacterium]
MIVTEIIKMLRPKQWTKNFFVLMPLVFGGGLVDPTKIILSIKGFILFSIAASSVYIFNDILDKNSDAVHPTKRSRPLAKGTVSIKTAYILAALLAVISLAASSIYDIRFFACIIFYLMLNISYTLFLKKKVILDIMSIAAGFEARIWAGSLIIGITPSIWLQLCVFILSVFLGAVKRRHEIIEHPENAVSQRAVLSEYSTSFLDQLISISATLSIVFYGLYAVSSSIQERLGSSNMLYTVPLVIYGIYRFLFLAPVKELGGDPSEILLKDRSLMICILVWIVVSAVLLYGKI